uniref:Uncharacterized protein n=1 Tax=Oryza rufipogon TaxID=4529 RepID=A0A0E0PNE0_ORYRU
MPTVPAHARSATCASPRPRHLPRARGRHCRARRRRHGGAHAGTLVRGTRVAAVVISLLIVTTSSSSKEGSGLVLLPTPSRDQAAAAFGGRRPGCGDKRRGTRSGERRGTSGGEHVDLANAEVGGYQRGVHPLDGLVLLQVLQLGGGDDPKGVAGVDLMIKHD